MNIVDFFDPNDIEHVKAYKHLMDKGYWPKEFWEQIQNIDKPNGWQVLIASKMADRWVERIISLAEKK